MMNDTCKYLKWAADTVKHDFKRVWITYMVWQLPHNWVTWTLSEDNHYFCSNPGVSHCILVVAMYFKTSNRLKTKLPMECIQIN